MCFFFLRHFTPVFSYMHSFYCNSYPILFKMDFLQFKCDMPRCRLFSIYLATGFLSFLDLWFSIHHQFWKILSPLLEVFLLLLSLLLLVFPLCVIYIFDNCLIALGCFIRHFHSLLFLQFLLGNFYWLIFKFIDSFFSHAQPTDEPIKGILHLFQCFWFGAFPFAFQHFHLFDYITHLFLYAVCATFINLPQFWDKHPYHPYLFHITTNDLSKLSCVLSLISRGSTWSHVHGLCV